MASKIILFLSGFHENAKIPDERYYAYPDRPDKKVPGIRTNDAPVRYLLRTHRAIREIICVVTELAKQTALAHFEQVVREEAPKVEIVTISYEENQDFSLEVIPAILDRVNRRDKIYLDVTGGFRNANMHLLLLSRVLSYCGIQVAGAVYSNLNTTTLEDVSHLFRLFDLVGGMQELTSLGSVRTLREYYEAEPKLQDPAVKEVIDCMARLTEEITLCQTAQIERRMDEFNNAMKAARECSDPLMRKLLAVFQRTFGKKMTTAGLIRWCVGNDMIQQALTVYTEHIPDVIMGGEVLRREPGVEDVRKKGEYEHQAAAQFLRGFLMLANRSDPYEAHCAELRAQLCEYVQNNRGAIELMVKAKGGSAPPPEIAAAVENIALVARLAYPDSTGEQFNAGWADGLPPEKAGLGRLKERFKINTPGTMLGFIHDVNVFKSGHLDILLERENQTGGSAKLHKRLRDYAITNEHNILRMAKGGSAPPPEIAVGVENIVLVAGLAYPKGYFKQSWANGLPPEKDGLRKLRDRFRLKTPPGTALGFINDVSAFGKEHLDVLLELKKSEQEEAAGHVYGQTLRRLPELLPGSGYAAECSLERLVQVSQDYLYIKALRNLVNHANERSAGSYGQDPLLNYLKEFGYRHPADLSLSDIRNAVLTALDNLQKAREEAKEA